MTPLSEKLPDIAKSGISFDWLANVLASDYQSVYVIDTATDGYVEYAPAGVENELEIRSSGENFYADVPFNCKLLVYPDDQEKFLRVFKKENFLEALRTGRSQHLDYRLVNDGETLYCHLKTIRGKGIDNGYILIGVQVVNEPDEDYYDDVLNELEGCGLARTLASLYESMYVADLNTFHFKRLTSKVREDESFFPVGGDDVREAVAVFAEEYVHPKDRAMLLDVFKPERALEALREKGYVSFAYRARIGEGYRCRELVGFARPNAPERVVIAVRSIAASTFPLIEPEADAETFDKAAAALGKRCDAIVIVDLVTNEYKRFAAENLRASTGSFSEGFDFFADLQPRIEKEVFADDVPMLLEAFAKERFVAALDETGDMALTYRKMINDVPRFMTLFAIRDADDPRKAVIAIVNVDAAVRREISFRKALGNAMENSDRDRLTRVRNKNAYAQSSAELDALVSKGEAPPFAIAVANVNGLKVVNDVLGSEAGDEYIKSACAVVCEIFDHSPVFRVGGDEFAVLIKGRDYEARGELLKRFKEIMDENIKNQLVTAAIGAADFAPGKDERVRDVFQRANARMLENKKTMKLMISGADKL